MNKLPPELIDMIVEQVDHDSLPALAATAKLFYRCAMPVLYRYIDISRLSRTPSEVHTEVLYGIPDSLRPSANNPFKRTTVRNLDLLLRTAQDSEHLRSRIMGISIDSCSEGYSFEERSAEFEEFEIKSIRLAKLLKSSLKYISLTRDTLDKSVLTLAPNVSLDTPVCSIYINSQGHLPGFIDDPVSINDIYNLLLPRI